MSLNKVMLIGRLGRDVDCKYTQSGNAIANLSLATDESYIGQDGNRIQKTEWHKVIVYGKQAENCQQYLGKGSLVFIEGKLQTRKWQDQQRQDRYVTEIIASRIQFLDRKEQGDSDNKGIERPQRGNRHEPEFESQETDDIPF